MKVYFCPVDSNGDFRVTRVIADADMLAGDFTTCSNIAKTFVEDVVSRYPELQDTATTLSWLYKTITIIPGNPELEELYEESRYVD